MSLEENVSAHAMRVLSLPHFTTVIYGHAPVCKKLAELTEKIAIIYSALLFGIYYPMAQMKHALFFLISVKVL